MTNPEQPTDATLLPCPRCGNRAFIADRNSVWCVTDRCLRLPPRGTEAEAIAAWNTRTMQAAAPTPNAAIQKLRPEDIEAGIAAAEREGIIDPTASQVLEIHRAMSRAPTPNGEGVVAKYTELLFAVAHKFEGETRHETALRYILEREAKPSEGPLEAVRAGDGQ